MLAQGVTSLPYPSEVVTSALARAHRTWSIALEGDGAELLSKVGVKVGPLEIYRRVDLDLDWSPAELFGDRVMLPVRWKASGGPPLFPSMEGTLHVEPDGAGCTRLTLNARYDPPLGSLGRLVDRVAMHRVAQLTMTDFVQKLAGELEAALGKQHWVD